jgi:hypothetical protein
LERRAGYDGNKHYRFSSRAPAPPHHIISIQLIPVNHKNAQLPARAVADAAAFPLRFLHPPEHARLARQAIARPTDYGLFIDGGMTPHNNPSFALLQMISLTPFKLCWKPGPDALSVVSIGTGTFRPRMKYEDLGFARFPQLAFHALMSMMTDAEMLILAQMQWLGECPQPWIINSEIGTIAGDGPPGGKMFRFLRYDVRLEAEWIEERLGEKIDQKEIERYRCMDDPAIIPASTRSQSAWRSSRSRRSIFWRTARA